MNLKISIIALLLAPFLLSPFTLGAQTTPINTNKQASANHWLSTNMVRAGRSRGGLPVRRAVLVGINTYEPPANAGISPKSKSVSLRWQTLDGCVNDVEEMSALLIAKFGFKPADIVTLTNQQATRTAILGAIKSQFVDKAKADDVAFFFYAGHGSQIVNSKSDEQDKRDETIVPADSWRGEADIRDKELRRLLNSALDRGVILTAIFDSCHSGSTARGMPVPGKSRHAQPILTDIADATNYGPSPEERGALIMAASQDDQLADEQSLDNIPHGAFSAALLCVLRSSPMGRSAIELFLAAKSTLQSNGRLQEPVLAGNEARQKGGLFGSTEGLSNRLAVAVLNVKDGEITLQGGRAAGLNEGCRLSKFVGEPNRRTPMLELTRVEGLASARAKVVSGEASDVHIGDIFEVTRWVMSPQASLRVWLPPANLSAKQVESIGLLMEELRKSDKVTWVDDPTRVTPTHVLSWDGSEWVLTAGNDRVAGFSQRVTAAELIQVLAKADHPKLFLALPPSMEMKTDLKIGAGTENDSIEVVTSQIDAQYLLTGTYQGGRVRYAWVLPNASGEMTNNLPLPACTYWFPTNEAFSTPQLIARQLQDSALRLGKVKSWLTIESPGDAGQFGYRLALSNLTTRTLLTGDLLESRNSADSGQKQICAKLPVAIYGDKFTLLLHADTQSPALGNEQRYVYVFTLDITGRSQLLWPRGGQGNSQRFPPPPVAGAPYPTDIPLNFGFSIGPPPGVDTYILLTSRTAIPDVSVLQFDGVRGGETRGESSQLQRLLKSVGSATRGTAVECPADWSIQRLSLRSVETKETANSLTRGLSGH